MFFASRPELRDWTKTATQARVAKGRLTGFLAGTLLLSKPLQAQTTPTAIQQSEQSASIRGVVLNANTNQPINRALVELDRRSILTGHDGRFEFSNLAIPIAFVKVTKPGFYEGLDPYQATGTYTRVGSSDELELRLYPEALVTGILTTPDGDPLPRIQIEALRRLDEESGQRWMMAAQTYTNADGEFRLPLPGGEYVIETEYSQARPGLRPAVLPTIYPGAGSNGEAGDASATIHLISGAERHLDLRPPVRPVRSVHVQIDGAGGALSGQNAPQIQAHLANGLVFSPPARGAEKPGEIVVDLPSGTFTLSALTNGSDDRSGYGETKVTVGNEDVSGISIHMQQATELTVEASIDPAISTTPSLSPTSLDRQLGIYMQRTDAGINPGSQNVSPTSRRGGSLSFSLLPGTYRLRSTAYNSWHIESANTGGTDLLTQDLVVDGSSSSLPLRLVATNETATVRGTVKLVGRVSPSYVYFIADSPSTTPVISARSAQDGSFSHALLRPGSYHVLASANRAFSNLADPVVLARFSSYVTTVTVGAGETAGIDLDAVPDSEWKQ